MSVWAPAFEENDVKIRAVETLKSGHYEFLSLQIQHKCFDGTWSEWFAREQIKRRDAACILLWDPGLDQVVMVEQFRVGLLNRKEHASPWLIEIVAGLIDEGETPEEAIQREALEEAGCVVKELIPITQFFNTPGGFNEKSYVYCGIISLAQTELVNNPDEDEDLKIHVLNWAELQEFYPQITTSASSIIALQWLSFHHEQLKSQYA